MRRTLTIHPDSSLSYYGYYLCGFEQALGRIKLRFSLGDLPALLGPRDGLAVITDDGKRIFIAADDTPTINPEALHWCDVYGKVNLDRSLDELSRSPKVVPIGPGFGIRWRSLGHDALYVARAGAAGGNAFARPLDLGTAAQHRYSMSDYLDRTGRSVVVFNTPAVHGCLGWKLGEFLALGKAIVTLPIDRELPEPLVDGVHVHVVDGSAESIVDAITRLRRDNTYRLALEREAAAYYQRWLHPAVVAGRLLRSGRRP